MIFAQMRFPDLNATPYVVFPPVERPRAISRLQSQAATGHCQFPQDLRNAPALWQREEDQDQYAVDARGQDDQDEAQVRAADGRGGRSKGHKEEDGQDGV